MATGCSCEKAASRHALAAIHRGGRGEELAPGVSRIDEFAPVINAYVVEDVLIDAARRWDRKRIFKAIEGRELALVGSPTSTATTTTLPRTSARRGVSHSPSTQAT